MRRDIVLNLEDMGFQVEASHHEIAPAQHEIDFQYTEALRAADNIMTFKMAAKTIAKRHGLHATFMPKPKEGVNGSGMHINMSLSDREGKNVFADGTDPLKLSPLAYSFMAGILHHMKAMTILTNPLVNSYKRLIPGYDAPIYIALVFHIQPKLPDPDSVSQRGEHAHRAAVPGFRHESLPGPGGLPAGGTGRHREEHSASALRGGKYV